MAIRADIDGLPIDELTGLEFASTNGRMHACGHDGHITMALTAAEILATISDEIAGEVVFIFQPSEELCNGAVAMIEDGVMDLVDADVVIGTHLWNQAPTGYVGVNQSTVFAGADLFEITVEGTWRSWCDASSDRRSCCAAANIINACQTVVAREISPQEMGVVTFGSVQGGSAGNVIADEVKLNGTIRAYNAETHKAIADAVRRITAGVSDSPGRRRPTRTWRARRRC